jgi:hypothetical protein
MVLPNWFKSADDVSGNAYLRERGAKNPEKFENKFISSGIVCAVSDGLRAAQANIVLPVPRSPRGLLVTCQVSRDGRFACIPHGSFFPLLSRAVRDGVDL